MAVSLTLTGSGSVGDIQPGWRVNEEATPVAPGDLSGGTGGVGLSAKALADSEFVVNNLSTFTHSRLGDISGKVVTGNSNGATEDTNTVIPLGLTTQLTQLNAERTARPSLVGADQRFDALGYSSALNPVAVDSNGYYLTPNAQVWNSDMSAAIYIFSGAPAATAASGFVDASGNYYLTYTSPTNAVYKYDSSGAFVTSWGTTGSGNGQFNDPVGITGDATHIYVLDRGNNRVQKFTPSGTYVTKWGTLGTGNGQFTLANYIASDMDGGIYVGDYLGQDPVTLASTSRIQFFDTVGTYISSFTIVQAFRQDGANTTGVNISSIAVDSDGFLWVSQAYEPVRIYNGETGLLAYSLSTPLPPGAYKTILGTQANTTRVLTTPLLDRAYMQGTATPVGGGSYWFLWSVHSGAWDLEFAIRYYISLIDPDVPVQYNASSNPGVTLPAWTASVWEQLKELGAAYNVQIDDIDDVITISDVGSRTLSLDNVQAGSVDLSLDSRATGRSLNISYGNYTSGTGTVYDATDTDKIFTVNIGQTVTETVRIAASPLSVNQPTQTASTSPAAGQYFVTGADNMPLSLAQWSLNGGSVVASISGTNSLDVTITAPSSIAGLPGPYQLAVYDGTSLNPAFSVVGYAVFTDPRVLNLLTGADPDKTSTEVAQDINNFAISTKSQAYDRGIWASVIASGPLLTLSATVPTSSVAGFGLCQGSLVQFKESQYRVTTAAIGDVWTSITATRHVTVGERDALFSTRTVGQHDSLWDGYEVGDEFVKPYRT